MSWRSFLFALVFAPIGLSGASIGTAYRLPCGASGIVNAGPTLTYDDTCSAGVADTASVYGFASASYTDLRALASLNVLDGAVNGYRFDVFAGSFDQLTVNSPGKAGQPGVFEATVTLTGVVTGLSAGSGFTFLPFASVLITQSAGLGFDPTNPPPFLIGPTHTITQMLPITYGVPFGLEIQLSAIVSLVNTNGVGWDGSASADFSETAVLSQIRIFDGTVGSPGAMVTNFSILSESGTLYNESGVVPEPSTLVMSAALIVLWPLRRRIRA